MQFAGEQECAVKIVGLCQELIQVWGVERGEEATGSSVSRCLCMKRKNEYL